MTTKTDITLPPLPGGLALQKVSMRGPVGIGEAMQAYARDAIEAVLRDRMPDAPQDLLDMLDTLCAGLEWNIENHPAIMNESDSEALAEARALMSRYSSGQPAASAEPVAQELTRSSMSDPCPHCGAGPYYYCAHPFRAARAAKGADHG
ncbi:hypothetical protein [Castellaniella ginsengisoli]|uniref:Uncharacterized protein n=1 Tax=Castellaniella ginsengisoli TaxID=546114 RepID=A0AB39CTY6_9BURK